MEVFARGYRKFPANIAFEWFGPLHHSIVWPWHLKPVDQPISPSWILKNFPEVSGDRIGECIAYQHTFAEVRELCHQMHKYWQKGCDITTPLLKVFQNNEARLADLRLYQAINCQIRSTKNLLDFYFLREEMFFNKNDNLNKMQKIVLDEIENTLKMKELCEKDNRLGYHSEAEGFLFFPEKLAARTILLHELLQKDFPHFDFNSKEIQQYTGELPIRKVAQCPPCKNSEKYPIGASDSSWSTYHTDKKIYFTVDHAKNKKLSLELAPCRLWPAAPIIIQPNGKFAETNNILFRKTPKISIQWTDDTITISIPIRAFAGIYRPGFPWQFNIHTGDNNDAWVNYEPWPGRLLQWFFNPASSGWLKMIDLPE